MKSKKKKDRLEELRKELGMKKGGKAKFPDLTGDGKVTRADNSSSSFERRKRTKRCCLNYVYLFSW